MSADSDEVAAERALVARLSSMSHDRAVATLRKVGYISDTLRPLAWNLLLKCVRSSCVASCAYAAVVDLVPLYGGGCMCFVPCERVHSVNDAPAVMCALESDIQCQTLDLPNQRVVKADVARVR